jgi:hypothetical protein
MNRALLAAAALSALMTAAPLAAQPSPAAPPTSAAPAGVVVPPADERSAQETQQRLQELLRGYPPSLKRVLQLDPALLTNEPYLAPYPALALFVAQHPDIVHHAAYYLGQPDNNDNREDPRSRAIRGFVEAVSVVTTLLGFVAFFITISWLARLLVDHRRWLRASKTQTEAQAKLFDRLTSNEDLLTYIQSPAGARFLQAAPMPLEAETRSVAAPISRILWSVQAGIILAVVGAGMWFAKGNVVDELIGPLNLVALLAISLGLGFAISAAVAFGLSSRLGLMDTPKP